MQLYRVLPTVLSSNFSLEISGSTGIADTEELLMECFERASVTFNIIVLVNKIDPSCHTNLFKRTESSDSTRLLSAMSLTKAVPRRNNLRQVIKRTARGFGMIMLS